MNVVVNQLSANNQNNSGGINLSKAEVKITDFAYKLPSIEKDGSVRILFKIDEKGEKPTYYRVSVAKDLWNSVINTVNERSYYIIKGLPSACVNAKGIPFVSLECTDINIVNGVENWKDKFPGDLPEGTEEVIPIESIVIPDKMPIGLNAKKKALSYFKKHNTFESPIILRKDGMILLLNYANYILAKDLGIGMVPVAYDPRALNVSKDEKQIKGINWYGPEEIVTVNTNDIVLTEDIHLNTHNFIFNLNLKEVKNSGQISVPVAVRPIEKGKYSLVSGVTRYFAAKILDIEKIPAVITDMSHDEFIRERFKNSSMDEVHSNKRNKKHECETLLSLITIPDAFAKTKPRQEKIIDAINYYKKNGKFDKPITIKGNNNVLVDGYKRYLAACELGLKSVWTLKLR